MALCIEQCWLLTYFPQKELLLSILALSLGEQDDRVGQLPFASSQEAHHAWVMSPFGEHWPTPPSPTCAIHLNVSFFILDIFHLCVCVCVCVCDHWHVQTTMDIVPSTILFFFFHLQFLKSAKFPASGHHLQLECCHRQKKNKLISHCQYWSLFAKCVFEQHSWK